MTLETLLDGLACGKPSCQCARRRGTTHCPAHPDRKPSFRATEREGRILVRCYAGCAQEVVIAELQRRGLWHETVSPVRPVSEEERARREVLMRARHELERVWRGYYDPAIAPTVPREDLYEDAEIRRTISVARQVAAQRMAVGDETSAWELLDQAARLETMQRNADII